jgi:hypothetical protein
MSLVELELRPQLRGWPHSQGPKAPVSGPLGPYGRSGEALRSVA